MTLVNESADYASPFKRGSRRATTIINTPNNEGDIDQQAMAAQQSMTMD